MDARVNARIRELGLRLLQKDQEAEPRTSAKQWQDFEQSNAWLEFTEIAIGILQTVRDELETIGKNENASMVDVAYLQGQCYTVRLLLSLPSIRSAELAADKQEEQEHGRGREVEEDGE